MKTEEFFEQILSGELKELDIYNHAQSLTDDFQDDKLNLLWNEYWEYLNRDKSFRTQISSLDDFMPEDPFEYRFKQLGKLLSEKRKDKKHTSNWVTKDLSLIRENKADNMTTEEFFEAVYKGELFDSDIHNHIEEITDGFNPEKLQRLCDDFDLYLVKKFNEDHESAISLLLQKRKGEISEEEYNSKIAKRNKPILFIDDFFSDRSESKEDEKKEKQREFNSQLKNTSNDIDINEINLTLLRSLLVKLKKEHITTNLYYTDQDNRAIRDIKKILRNEIFQEFEKIYSGEYGQTKQFHLIQDYTDNNIDQLRALKSDLDTYLLIKKIGSDEKNEDQKLDLIDGFKSKIKSKIEEIASQIKTDLESSVNDHKSINHINWLKSDDSLEHFIEALIEQKLIEQREPEDIIKDHFEPVREQNREPEPIEWLNTKALLAYMIEQLNENYIQTTSKWIDTAPHFSKEGNQIKRSILKSSANNYSKNKTGRDGGYFGKPKNYKIIDDILQNLPE